MSTPRICRAPGCLERAGSRGAARGYCVRHYWRWRRTGQTECAAAGCYNPVTANGWAGLCPSHVPEGIDR